MASKRATQEMAFERSMTIVSVDAMTMTVLLMDFLLAQQLVELFVYANGSAGYSQWVETCPRCLLALSDTSNVVLRTFSDSTHLGVYYIRPWSMCDGSEQPYIAYCAGSASLN